MKVIRVTMPDGSKWDVPADFIAKNAARSKVSDENYHGAKDEGFDRDSSLVDWFHHFFNDDNKLIAFSKEMDWEDVAMEARPSNNPDVDYNDGWFDGDKEVLDV